MKKILLSFLVAVAMISCDKNAIQQTTDSIKSADSLFTKANNGFKTLDSISKTINDKDGIAQKVIIPEIEKQKKAIDSTIKNGGFQIDSINKEIEKITKNVKVGTEVVKTLDSANVALNNGESAIKVLTKTADKILNQTKKQNPPPSSSQNKQNNSSQNQNNPVIVPPIIQKNPLIKTAKIEIEVDDISQAKSILNQKIRENNGDLISENYSENEGFQREYISVKVPLQNFDQLVSNASSQLGNMRSKESFSEGIDYVSGQMCDVEITLVQKENDAIIPINKDNPEQNPDSFSSKSSNAFMDGFDVLGKMMLVILPFWPLFLIGGIVWYFVRRNNKLKEEKEFLQQQLLNQQKVSESVAEKEISLEKSQEKSVAETTENDYSKYLPKN